MSWHVNILRVNEFHVVSCHNSGCQRVRAMSRPPWIKQRIGEDLINIQFTMNQWLQKVVFTIQMGGQLLLEDPPPLIDWMSMGSETGHIQIHLSVISKPKGHFPEEEEQV